MVFFEERTEEARRDAERIEIMKQALVAKRRFIMAASENGDPLAKHVSVDVFVEEVHETKKTDVKGGKLSGIFNFGGWGKKGGEENSGDDTARAGGASAPLASALAAGGGSSGSAVAALRSKLPPPPPAAALAPPPPPPKSPPPKPTGPTPGCKSGYSDVDEAGPLPAGWILQWDDWDAAAGSADKWYSNASTGSTSWVRPNADGTVTE
jgi:hypothetical protein